MNEGHLKKDREGGECPLWWLYFPRAGNFATYSRLAFMITPNYRGRAGGTEGLKKKTEGREAPAVLGGGG